MRRRRSRKTTAPRTKLKRGRKPIFTAPQKRILDRLIRNALRSELRALVRGL